MDLYTLTFGAISGGLVVGWLMTAVYAGAFEGWFTAAMSVFRRR